MAGNDFGQGGKFLKQHMKLIGDIRLGVKNIYNRLLIKAHYPANGCLRNDGIGIVAETDYICSLSQLARDFIDKISATSVPYRLLNASMPIVRHPTIKADELAHFHGFVSSDFDQRHVIHFSTIKCGVDRRYINAITPFWEFQSGMLEHRPGVFDGMDIVIAYSDFLKEYYESLVPSGVRVLKFNYPYTPPQIDQVDKADIRQRFSIPSDSFVVFFNFDYNSCYERKNPEAVLRAFAIAFSGADDALLVFKTSHSAEHPQKVAQLHDLARLLGIWDRIRFVDQYLSRRDVLSLTAAADVYISLHRGEGLGMGMLEAMSLKVPVVATAYGGNTDFTTAETSCQISYRMVDAKTDDLAYQCVRQWADPNVEDAATWLRKLRDSYDFRNRLNVCAQKLIDKKFGIKTFVDELHEYILS